MNKKLSYQAWRSRNRVLMPEDVKQELSQLHGIDADKEIESAMRKQYEFYLNDESSK